MPSSSEQSHQKDNNSGVRQNQHDNINDQLTCLYIGNIDKRVESTQLTNIFKKYGDLQYCYLIYEPTSSDRGSKEAKISRGYGFAKYVKMDDLMKAKQQLDGYQINGRKIKVQLSKRNKPRQQTPGRYLGKKRDSPQRSYPRHRGRSYSRSSSGSYYERKRHHQRKQKHRKRRERSRDSRNRQRSRDRDRDRDRERSRDKGEYGRGKHSYQNQHERRKQRQ